MSVNHCVIGEKTFKNTLIGPGNLPGLSRNGPPVSYRDFRETGPRALNLKSMSRETIGSFSNEVGDGNENVKKGNRLNNQTNNSARASHFLVHFFAALHD